MTMPVAV